MSEDTDISKTAASIQDSVSSAVDTEEIESMLEEDSTKSVGRTLGSRVGRELGSRIGRELGALVAHDIRERKGIRTILRNAAQRLVELVKELVRSVDIKGATSKLVQIGQGVVSSESAEGVLDSVLPGDESADESATEEGEDAATESAEEESTETDADEDTGDGVSADQLSVDEIKNLKEETYRELLEEMSYRDLQSLAKDVGVKANLAQDEMTDRIVAQFSEGSEA